MTETKPEETGKPAENKAPEEACGAGTGGASEGRGGGFASQVHRYPELEINLSHLEENIRRVRRACLDQGIEITGVVKGMSAIPEAVDCYVRAGVKMLGSSRISQLRALKAHGIDLPMMMIRIPMKSEAAEVVKYAEYSLNSELEVMEALNREAIRQKKPHSVVLMAEMGDLREGFWDRDELVDAAVKVEQSLPGLYLAGVGMNVGCYGSIVATRDKLEELVEIARRVEAAIGRKLDIVSGGATSSLMRVMDHEIPEGINNLRVGEGILNARDLGVFYGYEQEGMHHDVFTLRAEVIEAKVKPTHPIGTIGVDAFGHKMSYEDHGDRARALLAVGKADYGSLDDIFPRDPAIKVIGASSDHTIIDVEDCADPIRVGDIVEFDVDYGSMLYTTGSVDVHRYFVR